MTFKALLAREAGRSYTVALEDLDDDELKGEVLIEIAYSSLNYKDALAVTARGRIIRRFPMVLGIDLAGTVIASSSPDFKPRDRVVGTGQGLGEMEWGGYAERQRVKADAIVPLPDALSFEQAMQIGTAGVTAMLCVMALEQNEVLPGDREVVVTGAAGGVGSLAVMLLANRGYRVAASTGRPELEPYLRELGAASIVPREELAQAGAPMQSERWGGGVDTVGGVTLANLYAQTAYEGAIACCGMAGGHELSIAVWPMILRNVSLLGVSSLRTPKEKRIEVWSRLARELDPAKLAALSRTEPLSNILALSEEILAGRIRGRTVIDVHA
ncbi:MAG TPA: MDR family oxidoreductase [Thermoanaerobaculia bacterium]|nr:MDR family oxidoreductase [Thermoanaerobaculia bacterium]